MTKSTASPQYRYLCDLLLEARMEKRFSQRDLARKLGKPQSFISKFETGARRIDPIELVNITQALEIDFCELLKKAASYPKTSK